MHGQRDEGELQQFYEQWAPHVVSFCTLYTGDSQTAQTVTEQTFLNYFHSELPLRLDHLPTALMSLAVEEGNCSGAGGAESDSDFDWAVLGLPPDERAIFILHGMLDLQLPFVAAVTRTPLAIVSQLWVRALLQLRMSTVKDACSRLFEEYGPAPSAAPGTCA